jgi:2-polyprenyl-6-methoxyphenol hydroxylase-like FAD-dependent oxidoreductase
MSMTQPRHTHALVLGGSMAGLLAARVLADHFDLVSIVERDRLPEGADNRKGVPQGRHIHALLNKGYELLRKYFPGIEAALEADGAIIGDTAQSFISYRLGGYAPRFHSGLIVSMQSRALLESEVRKRVLSMRNVRLVETADAESLVAAPDGKRVTGALVRLQGAEAPPERIDADLVVDATGRGSQAPKWLAALGYPPLLERTIKLDLAYTSRVYRRKAGGLGDADGLLVSSTPPLGKRGAGILPLEGDRWLVTLAGYLGDHAPTEEQGFLEFARSMPSPDVYNAIKDAEPLGPIVIHKYPFGRRRYYEKMSRLPEGFIVVGDALCSFNPIYGQGMTVAAMEAAALDECLAAERRRGERAGMPHRFFRKVSRIVDVPWSLAASADFRYPEVEGLRPRTIPLVAAYMTRLMHASMVDAEISRAFLEVAHLVRPPVRLFAPRVVFRVLRAKVPPTQHSGEAAGPAERAEHSLGADVAHAQP